MLETGPSVIGFSGREQRASGRQHPSSGSDAVVNLRMNSASCCRDFVDEHLGAILFSFSVRGAAPDAYAGEGVLDLSQFRLTSAPVVNVLAAFSGKTAGYFEEAGWPPVS